MKRYRVSMVEFIGTKEFPQGLGMTWDSVVVEVGDDEEIFAMQADWRGSGFDCQTPVVRAWIRTPESSA